MSGLIKRAAAGTAVALAVAGGCGAATAFASSPAMSANANFVSGPFHVQFNASRAANMPADSATGSFTARTMLGSTTLMTLAGPVTCLDVTGGHVGLFYPVTSASPAVLGALVKGVFIFAQVSKSGKPQSVNFFPTPLSSVKACNPLPGLAPIMSGTLTLSP